MNKGWKGRLIGLANLEYDERMLTGWWMNKGWKTVNWLVVLNGGWKDRVNWLADEWRILKGRLNTGCQWMNDERGFSTGWWMNEGWKVKLVGGSMKDERRRLTGCQWMKDGKEVWYWLMDDWRMKEEESGGREVGAMVVGERFAGGDDDGGVNGLQRCWLPSHRSCRSVVQGKARQGRKEERKERMKGKN